MLLTEAEQAILEGTCGPVPQKILRTLVAYGHALDAERFVPVEGAGHFSVSAPVPGTSIPLPMLEELVSAGLRTKFPFTLDPKPPLDFHNLGLTPQQKEEFNTMFRDEARYQEGMSALGLRDRQSYTCSPYLPEAGNIPVRGSVLAWSESSCVVYANSVLAARTNRNAAIVDLFSNLLGSTPLFGLLTDEGRKADWCIEIRTQKLPPPQLLGGAIGVRVQEGIPYITGLDQLLGSEMNDRTRDYLKEMGAAASALGAVGLYHVEGITPEAREGGRSLLKTEHDTHPITDDELEALLDSYPVRWAEPRSMPEKCLIGCPHLSLRELHEWTDRIGDALKSSGRSRVAVDTVLVAPPQVLKAFRADTDAYQRLRATGARVSATCCEDYMNNRFCASQAVVTNSNKLRAFTNARMFLDDELAEIIATGRAPVRGERRRRSTKEGGGLRPLTPRPHSSSQDIFQGRPVFPARTGGEAVVSRVGFNSLACFYDAMLEEARTALCGDHDNRELFGKELTGKMLCAPRTIGSTSAGATWEFVARRGLAPKAILFAEPIDSLAAAGLAVADVWAGRRIGAVDRLGAAFLDTVENGDRVEVREDGTVVVPRADPGS